MIRLVDARELAKRNGVKCLVYGPAGTGKTPNCITAPRPVLCAMERGTLSLRNIEGLPAFKAQTIPEIEDFIKWCSQSNESKQFDTVCFDSLSEMAEIYLRHFQGKLKDGRQQYGEMALAVRKNVRDILNLENKHAYMIAKLGIREVDNSGMNAPFFPGKDLSTFVPHDVDEVFFVSKQRLSEAGGNEVLCYQTGASFNTIARDRSGVLSMYEFPHLGNVINKIMSAQ